MANPFFMLFLIMSTLTFTCNAQAQQHEPWVPNQVLDPWTLAVSLQSPDSASSLVISIGPGAIIKGSLDIGAVKEQENLARLQQFLEEIPRDKEIVLYCGCCPFDKCPNIRPAFRLMNSMGFQHHRLLNLKTNIKVDWIDKGYPTE